MFYGVRAHARGVRQLLWENEKLAGRGGFYPLIKSNELQAGRSREAAHAH